MKCGKLTAKLRDAVPVRFYENGKEIKRYKNIEIPDAIKELEFRDFRFDVPASGPITFKIFFAPGTLPEIWPEARQRKTRAKSDESIQEAAPATTDSTEITAEATEAEDDSHEEIIPAEDKATEEATPESMEIHFDVPGSARKALASAIGEHIGKYPSYKAAPSFAYTIGDYTLDRSGKLTGPHNPRLLESLAEDGYQTK